MQGKDVDTVIISDLHLGSDVSRAADALEFLQSANLSPADPAEVKS